MILLVVIAYLVLMTTMAETPKDLKCSFCSRPQEKMRVLIKGAGSAHICDKCVVLCMAVREKQLLDEASGATESVTTDLLEFPNLAED